MRFGTFFLFLFLVSLGVAVSYGRDDVAPLDSSSIGLLVITAAQDSAYGFHWVDGPGKNRRSLVWANGVLSIPSELELEGFGAFDLALATGYGFGGVGDTGRLLWQDGQYRITEPVLLTDGTVYFFADKGLLELVATRVRYFPPKLKNSIDPRASYLLLAGILVLIAVLIRRSRRITRQRAESS